MVSEHKVLRNQHNPFNLDTHNPIGAARSAHKKGLITDMEYSLCLLSKMEVYPENGTLLQYGSNGWLNKTIDLYEGRVDFINAQKLMGIDP